MSAMRFLRRICSSARDDRGTALIEMAFAMVVFSFIILGSFELARYVLLNQKLDRIAATLADLVSQGETISSDEITNLMDAAQFVFSPFEFEPSGVVLVTSISKTEDDPPQVNWQQAGAGNLVASSEFGETGDDADLPEGMVVRAGETVIIAEVFFQYTPFLFDRLVGPNQLYHRAFFRPRLGTLIELEGS